MAGIQPIQTFYNGYHFRSRLEARWAVLFDTLKVPYRYELDTYPLPPVPKQHLLDGKPKLELVRGPTIAYMPDFFLPDMKTWVEVKGEKPTEAALELCERLAHATGDQVVVCWGDIPYPHYEHAYRTTGYTGAYLFSPGFDDLHWLSECATCHTVGWVYMGKSSRLCACTPHDVKHSGADTPRLQHAFLAARRARFEFGETPVVTRPPTPVRSPLVPLVRRQPRQRRRRQND